MGATSMAALVVAASAWVGCTGEPPASTTSGTGDTGGDTGGGAAGTGGPGGTGEGAGGQGGGGGAGGADCVDSLPPDATLPDKLSATGLYADIANKTLAPEVQEFAPRFALWSDGAVKRRWIYLPECAQIDTSDMDDWSLPVGARLWKEFAAGEVRIETRLVERVGPGPHDFVFVAYVWNDDESEAVRTPQGLQNAKGFDHDVPAESTCRRCHGSHAKGGGRPSRALGFSALQLGGDGPGLTLAALVADGKLSHPPASGSIPVVGADQVERDALGYLHANCGHCHNATADSVPQIDLDLWLTVGATSAEETAAYQTAVGVANTLFNLPQLTARIEPGKPQSSSVWFRMHERGNVAQMPPVGSEKIDDVALANIEAWIGAMP